MNRSREAAERFAERRRREDAAPRLRNVAPDLVSCRLVLEDRREGAVTAEVAYTRRIVVEHAPALFVIPCGDPACRDGGHDLTVPILRGLREHRAEIKGEDTCYGYTGYTGSSPCGRILHFTAFAEYRPS